MIAEAIEEITKLADSKKPYALEKFADETVYIVPTGEGGWEEFLVKRQPTKPLVKLYTVGDALTWAAKTAEPARAAWLLGKGGVELLGDRDDKLTGLGCVLFQIADAWKYVCDPRWLTHRDFLAFIRRAMPFLPSSFLAIIKNLKIEKSDATDSEATATSAAMGKRFTVKASGAGDLPETVMLAFRPFFNVDVGATVNCVFEIDFLEGKIRLAPIDGEIDGNLAAVHEHIRGEIVEANPDWLVVAGTAA